MLSALKYPPRGLARFHLAGICLGRPTAPGVARVNHPRGGEKGEIGRENWARFC